MSQTIQPTSRPMAAALWMVGAIAAFSSMAVAGRAVASELDTFETMMYRSVIGVILVVSVISIRGRWDEVTTDRFGLHVIRNICHFTGQNLWFFAVPLIPLAQLFSLEFTSPLWVLLLAPLLLGEKMTRMRAFAAALGFVGIMIVARPGATTIDAGLIAAAASAIGFAGSMLFTKVLTRTATVSCILFWLVTLQLGFGIVAAGYDGDIAWPSTAVWPWLVLIGFAGLVAHLCLTTALSLAPATIVVPMDFVRLPVIAIVGMMFFAEPIDVYIIVGAVIIFAANYMNIWHESRR